MYMYLIWKIIILCNFSTRMIEIQVQLSQRAIELLDLPEDQPSFLLDIGYCNTILM